MALVRGLRSVSSRWSAASKLSCVRLSQSRNYADAPQMSFTFACPAQLFYHNVEVKQIDVPSFSGSFGILPNHVPVLAVLKPGVLSVIETDGTNKNFFVSSGSISVNEDSSVQILAEEAVLVDQLDPQACRDGLNKAQQELGQASTDVAKAEAQISIEVHEALVKAIG